MKKVITLCLFGLTIITRAVTLTWSSAPPAAIPLGQTYSVGARCVYTYTAGDPYFSTIHVKTTLFKNGALVASTTYMPRATLPVIASYTSLETTSQFVTYRAEGATDKTGQFVLEAAINATTVAGTPPNVAPTQTLESAAYSNSTITCSGWAADNEDGAPVSSVKVYVDGAYRVDAQLGGDRQDVATANARPAWRYSGYSCSFSSSGLSAGNHVLVTRAYDSGGLYTEASRNVVVTLAQTISFSNPGTQANGSSLTLNATASSGLPVNYVVTSGPATLSGNTLSFTNIGTVTVTASQAGNSTYDPAPVVSVTFSVMRDPNADDDHDGLSNEWETSHGLNPAVNDAMLDPDGDGLTNIAEFNLGSDPQNPLSPANATLPSSYTTLSPGNASRTEAVGATAGQFAVDKSGAATYSIPIWVTPGTGGMQPKLSLDYNSRAGSDIAGFGWSLNGMLKISRLPATRAQDGFVDGVDYDSNDRFALDGQRLILVPGTGNYGDNGAEYRTEIDTFSRIVSYGTVSAPGSGPLRFRVWTKDGMIIDFGNPSDGSSRTGCTVEAGNNGIRSWHVRRISSITGNYMEFSYLKDTAAGTHLLNRIDYTGNAGAGLTPYASVRFVYEDRADVFKGYVFGSLSAATKRLKSVASYYGETKVHGYTLTYADLATRNTPLRSILASITETGLGDKAFPATTFDYTNPQNGWEMSDAITAKWAPPIRTGTSNRGYFSYQQNPATLWADLNGDGFIDLAYAFDSGSLPDPPTIGRASWLNRASGWVEASGRSGQLDFRIASTLDSSYCYYSIHSGPERHLDFTYYIAGPYPVSSGTNIPPQFADYNGDGIPEEFAPGLSMDAYSWLHISPPGSPGGLSVVHSGFVGDGKAVVVGTPDRWVNFIDLNADGLPDEYKESVAYITGMDENRTMSCIAQPIWNSPVSLKYGAQFIDLNGDGLPDLITRSEWPGFPAENTNAAYINTGTGWAAAPQFLSPELLYCDRRNESVANQPSTTGTFILDINNDGIPDMIRGFDDPSVAHRNVYFGTGAGWVDASSSGFALPIALGYLTDNCVVYLTGAQFIDINGDGAVDYVWNYDGAPRKGVALNKRINPDRLIKITNGLGATVDITYAPLTERAIAPSGDEVSTVYDRTTGSTYPIKDLPVPPMYVVKTAGYDNGMNNADGSHGQYNINYRYGGLREHALRGSLGFETVTTTDSRTGIYTITKHKQEFPWVGNPISIKSYRPGSSAPMSQTDNVWDVKTLNGGKTYFPYLKQSYAKAWDLNGAFLSGVCTLTDYDDWGNPTTSTVQTFTEADSAEAWVTDTTNTYDNTWDAPSETTLSKWFIGRQTSTTLTASCPDQGEGIPTSLTRTSSFQYFPANGFLKKSIVEPGASANSDGANLTLITEYGDDTHAGDTYLGYDKFGNRQCVKISGGGLAAPRTTRTIYDSNGRFPQTSYNAKNHTETYTYDQQLGVVSTLTGPNNLTTSWIYDEFGRKTLEQRPRSNPAVANFTAYNYRWCSSAAPSSSVYQIDTVTSGSTPALAVYDRLGRAFYAFTINGGVLNGSPRMVGVRTWFDDLGRTYRTSLPFTCEGAIPANPVYASHTVFDLLNRPVEIYTADDPESGTTPVYRLTSMTYNGRTTSTTNAKNQVSRVVKNPIGLIWKSATNADTTSPEELGRVEFLYDGFGQLRVTKTARSDDSEVKIHVEYDARGRRTKLIDPDAGTQNFGYNAAAELTSQKDAKNQITTIIYDLLGRPDTRVELEGTTTWYYDTGFKGKLDRVEFVHSDSTHKDYTEAYTYDALIRPQRVIRTIDGVGYSQWQTYDDYSRPYITTYPGSSVDICGYQVKNIYDALGFLREVRDARATGSLYGNDVPAGYLYWKADGYALTGAINASTLGNGATLDRVISDITGRTFAITSGKGQAAEIQNVIYNFDAIGNVLRRQNSSTGSDEAFHYDGLNRLIDSNVNGASAINVTYDSLGSIKTKTNAGIYIYGENGYGPHALTSISGGPLGTRSFYYDANGNLTTETVGGISQRTQTWTSYNQMKTTTKNGRLTEFWFGANHERVLQQDNNGTKTVYIGSAMEIVSKGGLIERKTYIFTPAGRVAIRTERNDATPVETRFLHQDALGSVTAVTDEFGNVEQRFAFDAWGLRSQPLTTRTRTGGAITRGYTDHEQLDDYGLIHMNGRVYDPTLSRFLSTDAFVQDPLDNQTFNRYSYVSNNPTGRTDPNGWWWVDDNGDGTQTVNFMNKADKEEFLNFAKEKGITILNEPNKAGKDTNGKENVRSAATGEKGPASVTIKTETSKAEQRTTPVTPSSGVSGGTTAQKPVEGAPGQAENTEPPAPNSGEGLDLSFQKILELPYVQKALAREPKEGDSVWVDAPETEPAGWVEADGKGNYVPKVSGSVTNTTEQEMTKLHEQKHIDDAKKSDPSLVTTWSSGKVLGAKNERISAYQEIRAYVAEFKAWRARGAEGPVVRNAIDRIQINNSVLEGKLNIK